MANGEPYLFAEELQIIRQRLAEGRSYRAIGRELDRDTRTIGRNAAKIGLRSQHAAGWSMRKLSDEEIASIGASLEAGESYRAVARRLGVEAKAVQWHAKRNGWVSSHFQIGKRPC